MEAWNPKKMMTADNFARMLAGVNDPDERYAFFLGAGCSVTSGIPAAAALVEEQWLPKLVRTYTRIKPTDPDYRVRVNEWVQKEFGVSPDVSSAMLYGPVMEKLYPQERKRQRAIEKLCEDANPGYGYATLAQLMVGVADRIADRFNVVLTTNFDDLAADALFGFTGTKPLVIAHESLAEFIPLSSTKPVIVKLHGDAHLFPKNLREEIETIAEPIRDKISMLLQTRGLVVIGYGGNDEGILAMFQRMKRQAAPFGIYWVSREKPRGAIASWLNKHNDAVWVQSPGFDEIMLLIQAERNLGLPDRSRIDRLFEGYRLQHEKLLAALKSAPTITKEDQAIIEAGTKIAALFPADWAVEVASGRLPMTATIAPRAEIKVNPEMATLNRELATIAQRLEDLFASIECVRGKNHPEEAPTIPPDIDRSPKPGAGATVPPLREFKDRSEKTDVHETTISAPRQEENTEQTVVPVRRQEKGGSMVLVPAGTFKKGLTRPQVDSLISQFQEENLGINLDSAREALTAELELQAVLPAFFIDETLVTNQEFARFVDTTAYRTEAEEQGDPQNWTMHLTKKDHPVVFVSHRDAQAFCDWVGKRLPTADEWQKASRGPHGNLYPWGDRFDVHKCNTAESQRGWETTPVLRFENGRSFYGCYDMVGNVEEWTQTRGPQDALVVLGGSWEMTCQVYGLPVLHRLARPAFYSRDLGFRCTKNA